ncbi:MAG: hypothetical protein M1819_004782 [Sarea resinae]|nr:MAG: hypothetical protein M1819_004782 [Sarea resinae]
MDPPPKPSANSLFQVYLRLRPPPAYANQIPQSASLYPQLPILPERYLTVEEKHGNSEDDLPTHITIRPPLESRKRAVEKFAFTKVFDENALQLDIFKGAGVVPLIEGILGPDGREGRDGLLATLGVTGSGKSHTILGSKSQRGLTQMSLDVLFRSLDDRLVPASNDFVTSSLAAADASEAHLMSAAAFLEGSYGEIPAERGGSRAATPAMELSFLSAPRRHLAPRLSALPKLPDITDLGLAVDERAEYAVIISMYEVYNDRIFDLLCGQESTVSSKNQKDLRRRPLLFKSTELSPDRKVVAGLRKLICGSLEEALLVLETGLMERRVAGTSSNSVSSRSHGFFCVEVKKRKTNGMNTWTGSTLTIVDLAGSERARNAKTAGATLAEAGKINESLMYLGQCLQMQSDTHDGSRPAVVPFRQCKLTELLFSNSFPSASSTSHHTTSSHRTPQKAIMIVTADPVGDFNATSQILRYSALAREVTVPRIPSVTSTIFSGTTACKNSLASGRTTPSSVSIEELEYATQEMTRLNEEVDVLNLRLSEEKTRRKEAEAAWKAAEDNCVAMEQEVRDECVAEMERRIEEERVRWKGAWNAEADRNDEHLDKKLEILTQTIQIHEDPEINADQRIQELEHENEELVRRLSALERELHSRSPTKKTVAKKTRELKTPVKNRFLSSSATFEDQDADFDGSEQGDLTLAMENRLARGLREMDLNSSNMSSPRSPFPHSPSPSHSPEHKEHHLVGPPKMELKAPPSSTKKTRHSKIKTPRTTGTGAKKMRKLTTRRWDLGTGGSSSEDDGGDYSSPFGRKVGRL